MRKSRKGLLSLVLAGALTVGMCMTSYAGQWIYDGPENWKWWYQNDDGSYPQNDWKEVEGKWYHFDVNGYLDMGWHQIPTSRTYGTGDLMTTDIIDEWYYLDQSTGEMLTSGSWEGGCILSDGSLYIDEVWPQDGKMIYARNTYFAPAVANMDEHGNYTGTLEWKAKMLNEWNAKLSDYGVYGSFSMDYQLPSNWSEECPMPLMTAAIDYMCFNHWGGAGIRNWEDSWVVDSNNVIHIKATYYEYYE